MISNPSAPRWGDANRTVIILDAIVEGYPATFVASPQDVTTYGRHLFRRAKAGEFGPVAPFGEQ